MTEFAGRTEAAPGGLDASRQKGEQRSEERLRAHYFVERELAARLKRAPSFEERRRLAATVYDELYRRVPDHPMRAGDGKGSRGRSVSWRLREITPYLPRGGVFLDVGAGDCALTAAVARRAATAYAVDVHFDKRPDDEPANVRRVVTDGRSIDVPEASVDVAFSDQVVEHVHPDDLLVHLRNIHRALKPGGVLFCVTPNRLYGPSDISRYFDDEACGLHLREYSVRELAALLAEAGFTRQHAWVGARGWYMRLPMRLVTAFESALEALPARTRRRIAAMAPLRALLGVRIAAFRGSAS